MTNYNCEICNFTTKLKSNYTRHLNTKKHNSKIINNDSKVIQSYPKVIHEKKTVIHGYPNVIQKNELKIKKYVCKYCSKSFKYASGLSKHKKKCEKTVEIDKQLELQAKEIEELKELVDKLLNNSKQTHITKVEGDNTTNINQYIILNAFGKEKTDYINPVEIKNLIQHEPMNSVPKLLREIHFNDKHNENHNVYIPNKKEAYAKIYDGAQWILTKKKDVIEDMANKAFNLITDVHRFTHNNKIEKIKNCYQDKDKMVVSRIEKDTEIMILNNQDIVNKSSTRD